MKLFSVLSSVLSSVFLSVLRTPLHTLCSLLSSSFVKRLPGRLRRAPAAVYVTQMKQARQFIPVYSPLLLVRYWMQQQTFPRSSIGRCVHRSAHCLPQQVQGETVKARGVFEGDCFWQRAPSKVILTRFRHTLSYEFLRFLLVQSVSDRIQALSFARFSGQFISSICILSILANSPQSSGRFTP